MLRPGRGGQHEQHGLRPRVVPLPAGLRGGGLLVAARAQLRHLLRTPERQCPDPDRAGPTPGRNIQGEAVPDEGLVPGRVRDAGRWDLTGPSRCGGSGINIRPGGAPTERRRRNRCGGFRRGHGRARVFFHRRGVGVRVGLPRQLRGAGVSGGGEFAPKGRDVRLRVFAVVRLHRGRGADQKPVPDRRGAPGEFRRRRAALRGGFAHVDVLCVRVECVPARRLPHVRGQLRRPPLLPVS
mmetsp:Transcript_15503/g.38396  ORF Transcript_15503/g.38396 Transcript_15503/m.38396 type:complete len:239 (+) Transcript_15503:2361-3077(+)